MGSRQWLVTVVVLSVVWTAAAYTYDQHLHEQMVAEALAQCSDLDDKVEELECRKVWRAEIEKRLLLPSKQLSLTSAVAPVPFAWLATYFGMLLKRWLSRRSVRS